MKLIKNVVHIAKKVFFRSCNDQPILKDISVDHAQEESVQEEPASTPLQDSSTNDAEKIGRMSFPIWSRQINLANDQVVEAITALSEQFSNLALELGNAQAASRETSEELVIGQDTGISIHIRNNEAQSAHLIALLERTQSSKKELLQEIRKCRSFLEDLHKLGLEVSYVAKQTNLLSFNAYIEAASAGDAGKGFGAIANEVQNLSALSANSGKHILSTIENISHTMSELIQIAEQAEEEDEQSITESKLAIEEAMTSFEAVTGSLENSASDMRATSKNIQDEINNVLVVLQFQDRVSQILEHVKEEMNLYHEQFFGLQNGSAEQVDVAGWEERMFKGYSMQEQVEAHKSNDIDIPSRQETTFF
ncbi:MAG: hypothetical protein KUG75_16190 [Pseudomonadales bacterium]|nr:hypothetical protein [Pseudomonadales bacterium]